MVSTFSAVNSMRPGSRWGDLELSLMRRRITMWMDEAPDTPIQVVSPEDVVLLRLESYRLGNETSDRQWLDILGVLRTQSDTLDRAYLTRWASELGVTDLLDRAWTDA